MPKGRQTTVHLSESEVRLLDERGAIADRARGPFNRSAVVQRLLRTLRVILRDAAPETTPGFQPSYLRLFERLLEAPYRLSEFEIENLYLILAAQPQFGSLLEELSLAAADVETWYGGLSLPQRYALHDRLLVEEARRNLVRVPED